MTILDDAPTRNGHTVTAPPVTTPASPAGQQVPTPAVHQPADAPTPSVPLTSEGRWWMRFRTGTKPVRTKEERDRAMARLFCWGWLLFALTASVSGNVLHSWMTAPASVRVGAAIAAVVPPSVMLGATHLVVLLISTRRRKYRVIDLIVLFVVMVGAVGVAVFAFTISFYALRDLMLTFGQRPAVAWRWPVAVDLSLIVSSLALLSLVDARIGDADDQEHNETPAAPRPEVANSGPITQAERRLWWESIAAVVREDIADDYRKIAELTPAELGSILERMYDGNESGRSITDSTGLHHREVKAVKESADGILSRTAVTPAPAAAA